MSKSILKGQLIDVVQKVIYPAEIKIQNGMILEISRLEEAPNIFISPGFIDAHIHIESSMLAPSRFAKEAVKHGTIATVSDPHEIANVCGIDGVKFMIEDGAKVPFNFYFGAPSCVPATGFETTGATIDSEGIKELLEMEGIHYLSEMMNFPGAIHGNEEVLKKIQYALDMGFKVDGHAPGLRGEELRKYVSRGISTDHECFEYEEGREKLELGMKVIIREGSAAKNYEALKNLIDEFPDSIMFCSDDKHPDDLVKGHINQIVKRALKEGYDFWNVFRSACKTPIEHYNLSCGMLQEGDKADFIVLKDLDEFEVLETWINGQVVMKDDKVLFDLPEIRPINNFHSYEVYPEDFKTNISSEKIRTIECYDGQLITGEKVIEISNEKKPFEGSISLGVNKIVVQNRYKKAAPGIAFIKNFDLKKGAIASTVAHDCHNIVAIGVDDESLSKVINELMKLKGGIAVFDGKNLRSLELEIAGLMSAENSISLAKAYEELDEAAKSLGTNLSAPFMTLSFMALLVIPNLKLSDLGLFNGVDFRFENVEV